MNLLKSVKLTRFHVMVWSSDCWFVKKKKCFAAVCLNKA